MLSCHIGYAQDLDLCLSQSRREAAEQLDCADRSSESIIMIKCAALRQD
jgi:hypothetical protein